MACGFYYLADWRGERMLDLRSGFLRIVNGTPKPRTPRRFLHLFQLLFLFCKLFLQLLDLLLLLQLPLVVLNAIVVAVRFHVVNRRVQLVYLGLETGDRALLRLYLSLPAFALLQLRLGTGI